MKYFLVLVFLQILHSVVGLSMNPWSSDNQPEIFNYPTYKNPELPPPYQKCSQDTYGVMQSVEVIPCPSTKRCPLVKGSNVTLNLEFIPSFPANKVIGSIAGILSSYLPSAGFGKPEDLCASKQVECPLTPGKLYRYTTTVFVKHNYPNIKLDIKIQITGDKKEIACALIPVELVKPTVPSRSTFFS